MNSAPRNAPCPCGSGRKYKVCCLKKGIDWRETADGGMGRAVPITPALQEVLVRQRDRFIAEFGREPGPNDRVFFNMPPVETIEQRILEAMRRAKVNPGLIYAFEKTGRMVTEENRHLIPDVDLAEYEAAVGEYWARVDSGEIEEGE